MQITWLGTFLAVVLLDVDVGLVFGLALSILVIVLRDQCFDISKGNCQLTKDVSFFSLDNYSIYLSKIKRFLYMTHQASQF
jgi:hypothetical protein